MKAQKRAVPKINYKKEGLRYCLWQASDEKKLISIFDEFNVSWDSILEVEETLPDLWGRQWKEPLEKEKKGGHPGVLTVIILLTLTQKLGKDLMEKPLKMCIGLRYF
jgi:hypothetical protein